MKMCSAGLVQDGRAVRLDLVDDEGADVSLQLSLEQAQTIAMTLPSLLTHARQDLADKTGSRYVLALDRWTVQQSNDCTGLLLTLATGEGFEVCFDVPAEACRGLGAVLRSCSLPVTEDLNEQTPTARLEGTQLSGTCSAATFGLFRPHWFVPFNFGMPALFKLPLVRKCSCKKAPSRRPGKPFPRRTGFPHASAQQR